MDNPEQTSREVPDQPAQEGGPPGEPVIYTIGHSTHPLEEFIGILRRFGITMVIDVRTLPRSRHNPWFDREEIARSLRDSGIRYVHCAGLGGFRHPGPLQESVNKGWKGEAFRGYADYMQTEEFRTHLREVIDLAGDGPLVLMCAEAVPWHCHRLLIADALTMRGVKVLHILDAGTLLEHHLTSFTRVTGDAITYPKDPEQETLDQFGPE
jgi:uncharacterized protein (DUF488 family)